MKGKKCKHHSKTLTALVDFCWKNLATEFYLLFSISPTYVKICKINEKPILDTYLNLAVSLQHLLFQPELRNA